MCGRGKSIREEQQGTDSHCDEACHCEGQEEHPVGHHRVLHLDWSVLSVVDAKDTYHSLDIVHYLLNCVLIERTPIHYPRVAVSK